MDARDDEAYWVYAIEIHQRWMDAATAGSRNPYERFIYVGSTKKNDVRERVAEHLLGETGFGSGAGRPFIRVRAAREALGMPGPLTDGDDAWLLEDLTEQCTGKAAALRREGALARRLERRRGTRAHSDRKRGRSTSGRKTLRRSA